MKEGYIAATLGEIWRWPLNRGLLEISMRLRNWVNCLVIWNQVKTAIINVCLNIFIRHHFFQTLRVSVLPFPKLYVLNFGGLFTRR